jgi:VIT1/CCC1 family predicted Fe2+/Mn2+ transporter
VTRTTDPEVLNRKSRPAIVGARRRNNLDAGMASAAPPSSSTSSATFLLQRVQPALTGLIDGSLSTLAPIFAIALATRQPHYAFLAGLATAIGAGVSMAFSEGLSDTGDMTGRGNPFHRGMITGAGTFLGGILHTLPFLIPDYHAALLVAAATVAFELITLAWIRWRMFHTGFLSSFASVALGGAIIAGLSTLLGVAAG